MLTKRVLIVGIGQHRELALRTLLRKNMELAFVETVGSPYLRLADRSLGILDVRDSASALAAAEAITTGWTPDAVLSLSDPCLPVIGHLADIHNLHAISREGALNAHNKDRMRAMLHAAGVPVPRFEYVSNLSDAGRGADTIGYPVCVKPTNRAGSIGVRKVENAAELEDAVTAAWSSRLFGRGAILIEEWVSGTEVSVETVTFDGATTVCAITLKHVSPHPYCYEIGHTVPYHPEDQEALQEVVTRALAALRIEQALAHVEVMITSKGPVVIEVNARPAGDLIPDLIYLASGLNLYEVWADAALGCNPRVSVEWRTHASIRFLTSNPGVLKEIRGLTESKAVPGVCDVVLEAKPEDQLAPITSSLGRRGFVIAVGPTTESARTAASRAAGLVEFVTDNGR